MNNDNLSKAQREAIKETIKIMKSLQETSDHEAAHAHADNALCELLDTLGARRVVAEYLKLERWCA